MDRRTEPLTVSSVPSPTDGLSGMEDPRTGKPSLVSELVCFALPRSPALPRLQTRDCVQSHSWAPWRPQCHPQGEPRSQPFPALQWAGWASTGNPQGTPLQSGQVVAGWHGSQRLWLPL